MYCRRCLRESKGDKKVNMEIDLEEQRYVCPECKQVIDWSKEDGE